MKEIVREMRIEGRRLTLRKKISGASIYEVIEQVFDIPRQETSELNIRREKLLK